MKSDGPFMPEWVWGGGPDADVVISTRARLARSLTAVPFPARASGEDLTMTAQSVRSAALGLAERFPNVRSLNVDKLSAEQKTFLLDAHIVSAEQVAGGEGRIVILEPSATLSIMVNEEDHLRIQAILSGLEPERTWGIVDWADEVLSRRLEFGFSQKFGYLTANVSNVGTGLRVSAMMHLAGLALLRRLTEQLKAAYELGVSVRGFYGEGSRSMGSLFQVSNEVTLGINEREIVERVASVARYLLCEERRARKELVADRRNRMVELASRSLDALRQVRSVSLRDALAHLSPVRLAAELGLAENCPRALFNELLIGMRACEGDSMGAGTARAELVQSKLSDAHITRG